MPGNQSETGTVRGVAHRSKINIALIDTRSDWTNSYVLWQ